jgi:hypothetical protein
MQVDVALSRYSKSSTSVPDLKKCGRRKTERAWIQ